MRDELCLGRSGVFCFVGRIGDFLLWGESCIFLLWGESGIFFCGTNRLFLFSGANRGYLILKNIFFKFQSYQMTHLKRKQAIAEFGRRFATRQDYTEFVEHLLEDNSASFGGTVFPP